VVFGGTVEGGQKRDRISSRLILKRSPNALTQLYYLGAILMSRLSQAFTLLPCALLTLATPLFLSASPTQAQMTMKPLRTLTVSGRGTESLMTTIAQIRLGVEAQGKTANEVQGTVAKRSNSLVTLLKSRSVDKLETTGINLNPVYSYDNNKQTLTGYNASNTVSFRIANIKAGELIDDAVKAGASRVDGISFVATEDAIAAAQKVALRKATQEAQAQAQAVLGALNFTQKEIIGIQVNNAVPQPRPMENANSFAQRIKSADAPSPVIGGEQTVEATVTLEISY